VTPVSPRKLREAPAIASCTGAGLRKSISMGAEVPPGYKAFTVAVSTLRAEISAELSDLNWPLGICRDFALAMTELPPSSTRTMSSGLLLSAGTPPSNQKASTRLFQPSRVRGTLPGCAISSTRP
jgi:hypothetical protein